MLPEDDNILLSFINTKLRDGDLPEELCAELGADWEEIEARLLGIGYVYDAKSNRFCAN